MSLNILNAYSRKFLQASGRAEAPVVAFNVCPAFAFDLYDLTWRKVRKANWTVSKISTCCPRFMLK